MKNVKSTILLILIAFLQWPILVSGQTSIVNKYGQLSVNGNYIIGQYGDTVQLRGMSLFWSQWMPQYYNAECISWLKEDWKCTVIRAAMGVESGGYLEDPNESLKIIEVVDAAIAQGLYVVIDYHSHEAHKNPEPAKKFFASMAKRYGKYPNVLYEIYNEPLQGPNWSKDLKPYSEQVIAAIREYDPDNIIICGTRQWSQMVSEAAADPIKEPNIMYTLHFYAHTHRKWLMDEAEKAMSKGIALFVTEFGTCDASGNDNYAPEETEKWFNFMDKYKLSWCNWSVSDKAETASVLKPRAAGTGLWEEEVLTASGLFIRNELIKKNTPVLKSKGMKKTAKAK